MARSPALEDVAAASLPFRPMQRPPRSLGESKFSPGTEVRSPPTVPRAGRLGALHRRRGRMEPPSRWQATRELPTDDLTYRSRVLHESGDGPRLPRPRRSLPRRRLRRVRHWLERAPRAASALDDTDGLVESRRGTACVAPVGES